MRSDVAVLTIFFECLVAIGCGPAPQPVWEKDSRSFLYTQSDGSVMQYDLEKEAIRPLFGPGDRQPRLISLSPTSSQVAIAATALGEESRAVQVGIASLGDGKVAWEKVEFWGNRSAKRGICPSSCFWCPSGQRILVWYQNPGEIPALIQSSTPFGRFAVFDMKSQTLSELTTAPPAVTLSQMLHVSPLCPNGSGYLAMKLADAGPKFYFVSWDGWEYPLAVSAEVEALLKLIGDSEAPQQKKLLVNFPVPQGVWSGSTLKFPTRSGMAEIDIKARKITLTQLPADVEKDFKEIADADAADAPWTTVQTAAFQGGDLELHFRMAFGAEDGAARVELVDKKLKRRRILIKGSCPENIFVHHLFPSPDRRRILACLKDAKTEGYCIHVVQSDGTVFAKLDTGRMEGGPKR